MNLCVGLRLFYNGDLLVTCVSVYGVFLINSERQHFSKISQPTQNHKQIQDFCILSVFFNI